VMLFARSTGYRTSLLVVLIEVVVSVAGFAFVAVLARRWSLSRLTS
jgi:general stress protein CsbA